VTGVTQRLNICENAVLSGYITTLKNKQKLDVSSKALRQELVGPSLETLGLRSKRRAFARNVEFLLIFQGSNITTQHSIFTLVLPTLVQTVLVKYMSRLCVHLCDRGLNHAIYSGLLIISPQLHVRGVALVRPYQLLSLLGILPLLKLAAPPTKIV
jgi:hypothetical protein